MADVDLPLPGTATDRRAFYEELRPLGVEPLWERLAGLVTAEPDPECRAAKWSYSVLRRHLLRAGELISAEEAERRVLFLENPALPNRSALTPTLYCGLQLILPGEVAPPHRHSQSALRFVIEGEGAFTAVDGERVPMEPGDLILTANWRWHEHGSDGPGPVVWLDGLDIPFVRALGAGFAEKRERSTLTEEAVSEPSRLKFGRGLLPEHRPSGHGSPLLRYRYREVRDALLGLTACNGSDPHFGTRLWYADPLTGGHVLRTIGAWMAHVPEGFATAPYRSTDATILVVAEGEGTLHVDGADHPLDRGDIAVVPSWAAWRLQAEAPLFLFGYSDRPVQDAVGLWREQRLPAGPQSGGPA